MNEETFEDDDGIGEGPFSLPFDSSEYLDCPGAVTAYLDEALKFGDARVFSYCLGQVAKAIGMTELSRRSGVSRQTLYDALSGETAPRLDTIFGVLTALNVRLSAVAPECPAEGEAEEDATESAEQNAVRC